MRSLTPRQFFAMVDRLETLDRPRNRTIELMTAQLIAMVGNTGFREFEKPLQPKDFMPSLVGKKYRSDGKRPRRRSAKAFDAELRKVMEQAAGYQKVQANRGIR